MCYLILNLYFKFEEVKALFLLPPPSFSFRIFLLLFRFLLPVFQFYTADGLWFHVLDYVEVILCKYAICLWKFEKCLLICTLFFKHFKSSVQKVLTSSISLSQVWSCITFDLILKLFSFWGLDTDMYWLFAEVWLVCMPIMVRSDPSEKKYSISVKFRWQFLLYLLSLFRHFLTFKNEFTLNIAKPFSWRNGLLLKRNHFIILLSLKISKSGTSSGLLCHQELLLFLEIDGI